MINDGTMSIFLTAFLATGFVYWIVGGVFWLIGSTALIARAKLPLLRSVIAILLPLPMVLLGARLHSLVLSQGISLEAIAEQPMLLLQTGYRMPGGLLMGLLIFPLSALAMRVPVRALFDCAVPFTGVFLAIGRIACFRKGCCYGEPTALPWSVVHGPGSGAYMDHLRHGFANGATDGFMSVHPFAIYLALAAALTVPILLWLCGRGGGPGEVGVAGVALLCLSSAAIESLRETALTTHVPLRQMIPLVTGSVAALVYAALRFRGSFDRGAPFPMPQLVAENGRKIQ